MKQTPFPVINKRVNCLLNMRDCRAGLFIEIYFIHTITGQFLFWIKQYVTYNLKKKKIEKVYFKVLDFEC